MASNGDISLEDADMPEHDGEKVVTMMDVLQEQAEFEEDVNAVLGASDDKECTYNKGYIKRQAVYACMTCCAEAKDNPEKRAGICLACCLICHENHELVELYTKRNFSCDCGNSKFNSHPCQFTPNKIGLNEENSYNQNFSGVYCICNRPYPDPESTIDDEMIQCIVCEDWLHTSHLEATVPGNDLYSEMICKACMVKNSFLYDYTALAVNSDTDYVDVNDSNLMSSLCNGVQESNNVSLNSTSNGEDLLDNDKSDVCLGNKIVPEENKNMKTEERATIDKSQLPNNIQFDEISDKTNNDLIVTQDDDKLVPEVSKTTNDVNLDLREPTEDNSMLVGLAKCDDKVKNEPIHTGVVDNEPVPDEEKNAPAASECKNELQETKTMDQTPENNGTIITSDIKSTHEDDKEESKAKAMTVEEIEKLEEDNLLKDPEEVIPNEENDTDKKLDIIENSNILKQESNDELPNECENETSIPVNENNDVEHSKIEHNTFEESPVQDSNEENQTDKVEVNEYNSKEAAFNEKPVISAEIGNIDVKQVSEPENFPVNSEITNIEMKEVANPDSSALSIEIDNMNVALDEKTDSKRKLEESKDDLTIKKTKLNCLKPNGIKRIYKGATFWPSNFRQKLCTCNNCISMYKDLSVLFLIDFDDTITAYENLGKEKTNGKASSQYEKGLEALSSLDRVQQINALTEYNKMRDKLLDFLNSFKERKEVVKEEDIKAFFAGMKPKREPDGVYFCR